MKHPNTPLAPKKAKKAVKAEKAANAKALAKDTSALNFRQKAFTSFYLAGPTKGNATASALAAGYSEKTAYSQGHYLLKHPEVSKALENAQASALDRAEISVSEVLKQWWLTAQADPNELVENRRVCCRFCHGEAHKYQYKGSEWEKRLADNQEEVDAHDAKVDAWIENGRKGKEPKQPPAVPDPKGGLGFDPRKPPHEDCPECFGEGELRTFVKDSRKLSEAGKLLFAGIETTKDGIKIKTHDQAAARNNVAKFLGMLVDRHAVSMDKFDWDGATPEQLLDIAEGREPRK